MNAIVIKINPDSINDGNAEINWEASLIKFAKLVSDKVKSWTDRPTYMEFEDGITRNYYLNCNDDEGRICQEVCETIYSEMAWIVTVAASNAAATMGRSRSPRKAQTSAENGKKSPGRPSKAFRNATLVLAGKLDGDRDQAVKFIHDRLADGETSDLMDWIGNGSWRGDETPTSVFWEWVEYDRSQPE